MCPAVASHYPSFAAAIRIHLALQMGPVGACRWIIGGKLQQLRMTSGNGNNNRGGGDAFRFATDYFSRERLPRRNFEFHFGATDSTSVYVGLSVVHGRARKTATGICFYGQINKIALFLPLLLRTYVELPHSFRSFFLINYPSFW